MSADSVIVYCFHDTILILLSMCSFDSNNAEHVVELTSMHITAKMGQIGCLKVVS